MEMNRKIETRHYSNVERSGSTCNVSTEEAPDPYVNSRVKDTSQPYDIPGVCRSIYNHPVPAEPMEVVPMIQLDSFIENSDEKEHNLKANELLQVNPANAIDYLQMKMTD